MNDLNTSIHGQQSKLKYYVRYALFFGKGVAIFVVVSVVLFSYWRDLFGNNFIADDSISFLFLMIANFVVTFLLYKGYRSWKFQYERVLLYLQQELNVMEEIAKKNHGSISEGSRKTGIALIGILNETASGSEREKLIEMFFKQYEKTCK